MHINICDFLFINFTVLEPQVSYAVIMNYDLWLKFLHMDFGCGFLSFGGVSEVSCLLGLFFLFSLGFKLLEFDQGRVLGILRSRFDFKCSSSENSNSMILSCICGILNFLRKPNRQKIGRVHDDSNCYDDNEELFNVVKLRNLVKIEKDRADFACVELEKERMAAASAAEETMAMILRIQNKKSLVEMEAKQYRRLAEEKQLHDKDVILSLRRIVIKYKTEKSCSEDQVRLMKQKLKVDSEDVEEDRLEGIDESLISFRGTTCGDGFEDRLISSLDSALSSL